jgi:L-threonylcarbamoyladenylate synthase
MKPENIKILKDGGVGVIPTDTIYGLVGRAFLPETVKRISELKNRSKDKSYIVLINSIGDLAVFGIRFSNKIGDFLKKVWPGKVSIIFSSNSTLCEYLKRSDGTYAFRIPGNDNLRDLLQKVGFLVAPSANPEGQPPAKNIMEAKNYFGDKVDFYEDGGELDSASSTLIRIDGDRIEVLRQGAVVVDIPK